MVFQYTAEAAIGGLDTARAAALNPSAGWLKRCVSFAAISARECAPYSEVEFALDAHQWGVVYADDRASPAAIRAAALADKAARAAYSASQIVRAREAMRDQFEADPDRDTSDFYRRERLATILIETGARATHASDGPASTLITPADLVDLAAELVPIDDREDALFEAEQALRDYHWQIVVNDEEVDRLAAARRAATERLADATSLDDLADSLRADFGIEVVDADEIAQAAAKGAARWANDAHAAALLEADQLDARRLVQRCAERARENGGEIVTVVDQFADGAATEVESAAAFDLASEPGLLGDIARWSKTFAFRPVPEFAQPAALATLAAIFGRRWATPTGLGVNLYLIAIGETGGGKDALLGAPKALLAGAGFRHLIGPGDFSSDAAIELSLRTRPSQLMPLDEFGKLAQAMMGRTAPSFARLAAKALLEVYPRSSPGSEWTGKQRADERDNASDPIYSPTLSLLAVSTPEGFFEGMSQQTLDDGFLNRLTVIRAGKAGDRQRDPARLTPPPELIDALRSAYEASSAPGNLSGATSRLANAAPPMRFARWADDVAIAAIEKVEAWEDDATDAGRRGVAGRAAEQTQKIATIRALSRNPADPAVTSNDIDWAFAMVRTSIETIEDGARSMMAGSDFESLCNLIEAIVTDAGAAGLAWSTMLKKRGIAKYEDRHIEAAVKRLEHTDVVTCGLKSGPQGGRPGKRIRAKCFD